jgi:type I pantothenate kinase
MDERLIDVAGLAALIAARASPGEVLLVGLTGSVAAGKTTLATALAAELGKDRRVQAVATDGFLLPNATLDARGILNRKGFPETYDVERLEAIMRQARSGPVRIPVYSHVTYDIDPNAAVEVDRPDILILEGLGLAPLPDGRNPARDLDLTVYIDATEPELEAWFVDRFVGFWRAAERDPTSFYAQFRRMDEPQTADFAKMVWTAINLPNLRSHIVHARDLADIVLRKAADHTLRLVRA